MPIIIYFAVLVGSIWCTNGPLGLGQRHETAATVVHRSTIKLPLINLLNLSQDTYR